jgi:hypothetical protein
VQLPSAITVLPQKAERSVLVPEAGAESPAERVSWPGTRIRTEHGRVAIEDVKIGDKVWLRNLSTGRDELRTVEEVYVRHVEKLLTRTIAGGSLTTTEDHPFSVDGKGWTRAGDVVVGDVQVTPDDTVALDKIEVEERAETVYNFRVPVDHDYYALAGDSPVLVPSVSDRLRDPDRTAVAGRAARVGHSMDFSEGPSRSGQARCGSDPVVLAPGA